MVSLRTDLGNLRESARRNRIEASGSITATDVQKGLENLDTGKLANGAATASFGSLIVSTSFVSFGTATLSSATITNTLTAKLLKAKQTIDSQGVDGLVLENSANSQSLYAVTGADNNIYFGPKTANGIVKIFDFGAATTIVNMSVTGVTVFFATTLSSLLVTGSVVVGSLTVTGVASVPSGTVTQPGLAIIGDLNTGVFSVGADQLAMVAGGIGIVSISTAGAGVTGILNVTATASVASLLVTTTATILGVLAVSSLSVTGTATVFGNMSISTLTVTTSFGVVGTATLAGATGISALTVTTTATVLGNTTLSAVTVTNAARVGSLVVTTTGSVLGILAVSSLSVTSTMTVFGAATVSTLTASAGIVGTTTSDSAATGFIGEYVQSAITSAGALTLTSGTPTTITSFQLTPGDWDVSFNGFFNGTATTTINYIFTCISNTTNVLDVTVGKFSNFFLNGATPLSQISQVTLPIMPYRVSLNASTTVFMVSQISHSASTAAGYGLFRARRIR